MTLSSPKKVSVLIPTYQYARFLPQAIESILNQSFTDFELIISDDDSNDGSAEIIHRYAAQDDRIRFKIQSSNLGMVRNWNWCLQEARGHYVKYVFGDDFLLRPDAIARLIELIEAEPGISLAASARTIVDEKSKPLEVWSHVEKEGVRNGAEIICSCLHNDRNLIGEPTTVLFRREDAKRGFDTTFKQVVDLEFWLHLLRGGSLAYTATPVCAFRRHPLQQTEINRRTINGESEHLRLISLYAEYFLLRPEHSQKAFIRLYQLRKKCDPQPLDMEMMDVLASVLGDSYYLYWVRHKIMRPFANIRRSWKKHVLHSRQARGTAATAACHQQSDTK